MRSALLSPFLIAVVAPPAPAALPAPAPQAFHQEVAHKFGATEGLPAGGIQLLDLDPAAPAPRVFADGCWFELRENRWSEVPAAAGARTAEFPVILPGNVRVSVPVPFADVVQVQSWGASPFVVTKSEIYSLAHHRPTALGWPHGPGLRQGALSPAGELHVASSAGLHRRVALAWEQIRVADGFGRAWATEDVLGVAFDSLGQLWLAMKAGVACRTTAGWRFFEGKDGLPWNDFTGAAAGPSGEVWFGTRLGAIRWDGREFHYRQGPRWLPQDDVRQTAVDRAGHAWFATAGGVGRIERRAMTLAAKAEFFEAEIEKYVKRTPYGFVAEARLRRIADQSSADPGDSDNDGLWTAMYGAGECFAYAATRSPKSRERATQAFEALRFLQKVTQGGHLAPPRGYVARTVRPVEWPDPNVGRLAQDQAQQKQDALWKAYEPRWPRSADGRWFWKSDTSSDELDGHYFFYPLYYDFLAETAAEKERVREVVRDLTDHLIAHGFTLVDHDGKPTRWGVYAPESLNRDARWWVERGLNSLSILSYLAVAGHVTGDTKYTARSRELIERHGYAQNLMYPKAQFGPGSGNQSDDEMAFMCFYHLLRYSGDEELKNLARTAWYAYWQGEAPELNPFFNFAYAAHATGRAMRNLWGEFPVSPRGAWHEESMATLYGFPLDRLNWPHRNSHRLDLVRLSGVQSRDFYEPAETGRGHRVNGRVLPVENRHFNHWNTDPWNLDYGGNGGVLGAGTVFLLPYYLGLYHGFIAKP